ncbi:hypothetical protein [Pseudonocardia alni]|uniref:hypothetical protein n=1 Tax=Pseudonocardia alni TaxID=33907 RepID=UPI0038708E2E
MPPAGTPRSTSGIHDDIAGFTTAAASSVGSASGTGTAHPAGTTVRSAIVP